MIVAFLKRTQKIINKRPKLNLDSKRTLLINSTWEPLTFVSQRKVISLLIRDKVEIVSIWKDDILIPHIDQNLPAVIRLKKRVKKPLKSPRFHRKIIFVRDDWRCQYCNVALLYKDATIDHVLPRSQGGKTDWKNCVTSCKHCNLWKADKIPERAGMRLMKQPDVPNIVHFWNTKEEKTCWHPDWDNIIYNK